MFPKNINFNLKTINNLMDDSQLDKNTHFVKIWEYVVHEMNRLAKIYIDI